MAAVWPARQRLVLWSLPAPTHLHLGMLVKVLPSERKTDEVPTLTQVGDWLGDGRWERSSDGEQWVRQVHMGRCVSVGIGEGSPERGDLADEDVVQGVGGGLEGDRGKCVCVATTTPAKTKLRASLMSLVMRGRKSLWFGCHV